MYSTANCNFRENLKSLHLPDLTLSDLSYTSNIFSRGPSVFPLLVSQHMLIPSFFDYLQNKDSPALIFIHTEVILEFEE